MIQNPVIVKQGGAVESLSVSVTNNTSSNIYIQSTADNGRQVRSGFRMSISVYKGGILILFVNSTDSYTCPVGCTELEKGSDSNGDPMIILGISASCEITVT